jgi:hypothetical protein
MWHAGAAAVGCRSSHLASIDSIEFCQITYACRFAYPGAVWSKLISLLPEHRRQQPVAIDLAVGCAGRAGLELAKR